MEDTSIKKNEMSSGAHLTLPIVSKYMNMILNKHCYDLYKCKKKKSNQIVII